MLLAVARADGDERRIAPLIASSNKMPCCQRGSCGGELRERARVAAPAETVPTPSSQEKAGHEDRQSDAFEPPPCSTPPDVSACAGAEEEQTLTRMTAAIQRTRATVQQPCRPAMTQNLRRERSACAREQQGGRNRNLARRRGPRRDSSRASRATTFEDLLRKVGLEALRVERRFG